MASMQHPVSRLRLASFGRNRSNPLYEKVADPTVACLKAALPLAFIYERQ